MEDKKKVLITGLIFLGLLCVGGGLYYFLVLDRFHEPAKSQANEAVPGLAEESAAAAGAEERSPVALDDSDAYVRANVQGLSSQPVFAAWLKVGGLVRRFVAAVDNVANGVSPRPHLEFLEPDKEFTTVKKGRQLLVDPASYGRYDVAADVFSSLDTAMSVKAYRSLRPLIRDAYRELGYPKGHFNDRLVEVIDHLLAAPQLQDPVALVRPKVFYLYADPELEMCSAGQKILMRMGAEHAGRLKAKLRDIRAAIAAQPALTDKGR